MAALRTAADRYTEAADIYRAIGDKGSLARQLFRLGQLLSAFVYFRDEGPEILEEAIELLKELVLDPPAAPTPVVVGGRQFGPAAQSAEIFQQDLEAAKKTLAVANMNLRDEERRWREAGFGGRGAWVADLVQGGFTRSVTVEESDMEKHLASARQRGMDLLAEREFFGWLSWDSGRADEGTPLKFTHVSSMTLLGKELLSEAEMADQREGWLVRTGGSDIRYRRETGLCATTSVTNAPTPPPTTARNVMHLGSHQPTEVLFLLVITRPRYQPKPVEVGSNVTLRGLKVTSALASPARTSSLPPPFCPSFHNRRRA